MEARKNIQNIQKQRETGKATNKGFESLFYCIGILKINEIWKQEGKTNSANSWKNKAQQLFTYIKEKNGYWQLLYHWQTLLACYSAAGLYKTPLLQMTIQGWGIGN